MSDILNNHDDFEDRNDFSILLQSQNINLQSQNINIDTYFRKKSIKNIVNIDTCRCPKTSLQFPNTIDITPVDSSMCVKKNKTSENTLRFNLFSPVFDSDFNWKHISHIELIKNFDGSVDFIIKFDKQSRENKKCITKIQRRQKRHTQMPVVQEVIYN